MSLIKLYGHTALRENLATAVARGGLPASLLFHGSRGVGKQQIAIWLGRALLCSDSANAPCEQCENCRFSRSLTHPDLHWIFPRARPKNPDQNGDEVRQDYAELIADRVAAAGLYEAPGGDEGIQVATVRALVHAAAMSPAMARRKVIIVGDAERMVAQEGSDQAANAFLKLLEEPPADTTVLLTSSEPGSLLPTIRSRVIAVRVAPLTDGDVRQFLADPAVEKRLRVTPDRVGELVRIAGGAPGHLLAQDELTDAVARARRMLDAAAGNTRTQRFQVSMAQGSSGARGRFSDTLDALTGLLHERAKSAVAEDATDRAFDAARAMDLVEEAKELVTRNVNPSLVTASLIRRLSPLVR